MTRWQRVVLAKAERFDNLGFRQDGDELRALLPKRRPAKPSKVEAPGKSKQERRGERNARVAQVREAVMERCRGRCEVCATGRATEAHHVFGGGLRRAMEHPETVLGLCDACHRAMHRGNRDTLESAALYCAAQGFSAAVAGLNHRISKITEARSPGYRGLGLQRESIRP